LHERPRRIISDIVKAILDIQVRDWEDFGSTTLKRPIVAGVETDTCFYIQNAAQVQNYVNLDLSIYPPPDLAPDLVIESDVTSKTVLNAYEALEVPEVWIYSNSALKIYIFESKAERNCYIEISSSPTFPDLDMVNLIPKLFM